jgi:hypothetical protein
VRGSNPGSPFMCRVFRHVMLSHGLPTRCACPLVSSARTQPDGHSHTREIAGKIARVFHPICANIANHCTIRTHVVCVRVVRRTLGQSSYRLRLSISYLRVAAGIRRMMFVDRRVRRGNRGKKTPNLSSRLRTAVRTRRIVIGRTKTELFGRKCR